MSNLCSSMLSFYQFHSIFDIKTSFKSKLLVPFVAQISSSCVSAYVYNAPCLCYLALYYFYSVKENIGCLYRNLERNYLKHSLPKTIFSCMNKCIY